MFALQSRQIKGFLYIEVLVASLLIALAMIPAMNALQTGVASINIHQSLVTQQYNRLSKMEQLQSEPFNNLLTEAAEAGSKSTISSYSDAPGSVNRRLVYLSLYDADADPFSLTDPNSDGDNNIYTGSTANLIWIRVETEGTPQGLETLISR